MVHTIIPESPDDLAAEVVRALVERTGIDPNEIEDVVLGNTQQQREQGVP